MDNIFSHHRHYFFLALNLLRLCFGCVALFYICCLSYFACAACFSFLHIFFLLLLFLCSGCYSCVYSFCYRCLCLFFPPTCPFPIDYHCLLLCHVHVSNELLYYEKSRKKIIIETVQSAVTNMRPVEIERWRGEANWSALNRDNWCRYYYYLICVQSWRGKCAA